MPKKDTDLFPPLSFLELSEASEEEIQKVIWLSAFAWQKAKREYYVPYRERIFRFYARRIIHQELASFPSYLEVLTSTNDIRFSARYAYFYRLYRYCSPSGVEAKVKLAWIKGVFEVSIVTDSFYKPSLFRLKGNVVR